jgi:hypothetical protein
METLSQLNSNKSTRFPNFYQKKKSNVKENPARLAYSVIEESKKLESINRRISKTSGYNILKHINAYRKSVSPEIENGCFSFDPSTQQQYYDQSQSLQKERNLSNYSELPTKYTLKKPNPEPVKEFSDVEFKPVFWPRESIIDDTLYEAMSLINEQDRHLESSFYTNAKPTCENIRIKSRIRHATKKHEVRSRRNTPGSLKNSGYRVSTPWNYSSKFSSVFYPKFAEF